MQRIVSSSFELVGYEVLIRLYGVPDALTEDAISKLSIDDLNRITSDLLFRLRLRCLSEPIQAKEKIKLFINIEKQTLASSGAVDELLEAASDFLRSGFMLVVEVTERPLKKPCSMRNYIDGLLRLTQGGVDIAMDDYNIDAENHIELEMKLPSLIKVDIEPHGISLIPAAGSSECEDLKFRARISDFLIRFRTPLLAERVETVWQLEILSGMQFKFFQGYFIGKPWVYSSNIYSAEPLEDSSAPFGRSKALDKSCLTTIDIPSVLND